MRVPISPRLFACCSFVHPGDRVADIGCDHGYLGIYLLLNNIASSVIAADMNPQPLESAFRNAHRYGTADRMSFHLSNGTAEIPRDFDTMVCAGMGADSILSILSAAPWLQSTQYRLILQCQSKTHVLRNFLSQQGWCIAREAVLQDGRFLYTVMEVLWQPNAPKLTLAQQYVPPALLVTPSAKVPDYYRNVLFRLTRAVTGQGAHAAPELVTALEELRALAESTNLHWLKEETP